MALDDNTATAGQFSLPVRPLEALPHQLDLRRVEAVLHESRGQVTAQHRREDRVRAVIGNPQLVFVVDTAHEIGARRLVHDRVRNAHVSRQRPHLRLEEIAEWIDRWRVVRVPREVPEEALTLVARPQRKRVQGGGLVEQHDAPGARHEVALAKRRDLGFERFHVGVDGVGYVDRARGNAGPVDHRLGVLEAVARRRAIRESERVHVVRAQGRRRQHQREAGVDSARRTDHDALEATSMDFVPNEANEHVLDRLDVQLQRRRGVREGRLATRAGPGQARPGLGTLRPAGASHEPQEVGQHSPPGHRGAATRTAPAPGPRGPSAPQRQPPRRGAPGRASRPSGATAIEPPGKILPPSEPTS